MAVIARVTLRLNGAVPNLQAFLDDPVHAAQLTGTIEVEGMTSNPAPVEGGTLHLLARGPSYASPGSSPARWPAPT